MSIFNPDYYEFTVSGMSLDTVTSVSATFDLESFRNIAYAGVIASGSVTVAEIQPQMSSDETNWYDFNALNDSGNPDKSLAGPGAIDMIQCNFRFFRLKTKSKQGSPALTMDYLITCKK